jgi:hypothetical protein
MRQTVVGVFERHEAARHAADLLAESGFGPDAVQVTDEPRTLNDAALTAPSTSDDTGVVGSIRHFFAGLFGSDDRPMAEYAEAVRRGATVVKVQVDDEPRLEMARETLQSAGAVDIEERVAAWREAGWSTGPVGSDGSLLSDEALDDQTSIGSGTGSSMTQRMSQGGGQTQTQSFGRPFEPEDVPLLRDEVEFNERPTYTGGVRVYPHADNWSAEDRMVDEAEATSLRDTSLVDTPLDFESLDDDFRSHWRNAYGTLGGSYEDYRPAYRYGHALSDDDRYAGREWDDIVGPVRTQWETDHPDGVWEQMKDAIRQGWLRMKS